MTTGSQSQAERRNLPSAARPKKVRSVFNLIVWLATVGAAHGQQLLFHDDFNNLSNWIPFGDPLPLLLTSYQGREGVFDNNGDPNYNSGAISRQQFELSGGYIIESEVYLDFQNLSGCWADANVGIADTQFQSWGGYEARLQMSLDAVGDACWAAPPEYLRHSGVGVSYETDTGVESYWIVADHLTNRWVTLTINLTADGFPTFLADGALVHQGSRPASSRLCSGTGQLWLGSRSSGSAGKAYHDWVRFSRLSAVEVASLRLDQQWPLGGGQPVHAVAVAGQRALAMVGDSGIAFLDLSNPTNLTVLGTWEAIVPPYGLALSGSTAYIAGWEANFLSTLEIVDFTDPGTPVLRGFYDTPGYAQAVALFGSHAAVADDEAGILLLDVRDPTAPVWAGHFATQGPVRCVKVLNPAAARQAWRRSCGP